VLLRGFGDECGIARNRRVSSVQFTHQQMHYLLNLENLKIYIKIHTKYRSYMFRSTTNIRELVLSLAKVILKRLVKYVFISVSKNSNEMTPFYSTLLFPVGRSTCFGHIPCPSSGAQLTVLTASGVDKL
jgi:hypothetical protein